MCLVNPEKVLKPRLFYDTVYMYIKIVLDYSIIIFVIILNNNCSDGERRDLLWDALKSDSKFNEMQRLSKAKELENNLLNHIFYQIR